MTASAEEVREEAEWLRALCRCFDFFAAADLIIKADKLYLEAGRWAAAGYQDVARIRCRIAARIMARAKRLTGERGLPWGVPFPEVSDPDAGGQP